MSLTADKVHRYSKILIVAAIDVGTTCSGYAFSFKSDYENDPLKVHVPSKWIAGSAALMSFKTPTVLLLYPDLSFNSFGYDAENNYSALKEDKKHYEYRYFKHFKTEIKLKYSLPPQCITFNENQRISVRIWNVIQSMFIEDENGHKVKALTAYAMLVKYLTAHCMENIRRLRQDKLMFDEVLWVLTVPAKSNERSKQFTREAAELAGVKRENLVIALEPEAASLFCMHLPVDKMGLDGQATELTRSTLFSKGTKYMVVDARGETVQITMYEVKDTGKLLELGHAKTLACGSKNVDTAYTHFLQDIVGPDMFDTFRKHHPDDYLDLYREFETKKRTMSTKTARKETIKIPSSLIEVYYEETQQRGQEKTFNGRLTEMAELEGKVALKGNKIRLDADIVTSWFDEPCTSIVQHVRDCLKWERSQGINTILLIGGFSESEIFQETFRSSFHDKRIIIPAEPILLVLKGAVLYGHNPLSVERRRSLFSWK